MGNATIYANGENARMGVPGCGAPPRASLPLCSHQKSLSSRALIKSGCYCPRTGTTFCLAHSHFPGTCSRASPPTVHKVRVPLSSLPPGLWGRSVSASGSKGSHGRSSRSGSGKEERTGLHEGQRQGGGAAYRPGKQACTARGSRLTDPAARLPPGGSFP